jgi:hypothetical protein
VRGVRTGRRDAVLPDFFVIGAMKAGTSTLYDLLRGHPEIYMSPVKEPNYFAFAGESRADAGPGDRDLLAITDREAYLDLFRGVTTEKVVGEASTVYLYHATAPRRILEEIPDAKFVAVLRDPVERAYSNYVMWTRRGWERCPTFREALAAEDARVRDGWDGVWHYRRRGFYFEQLKRYYDRCDPERIRVYLFEHLTSGPEALLRDICRFLRVDDALRPATTVWSNPGGLPRSALLHRLLRRRYRVKSWIEPMIPMRLRRRLSAGLVRLNLRRAPPLPEDVRRELREAYRPDILKLQGLIGRDLSHWLR